MVYAGAEAVLTELCWEPLFAEVGFVYTRFVEHIITTVDAVGIRVKVIFTAVATPACTRAVIITIEHQIFLITA